MWYLGKSQNSNLAILSNNNNNKKTSIEPGFVFK